MKLLLFIPLVYVSFASAMDTTGFRRGDDIEDRRLDQVEPVLTGFKQERDYLIKVAGVMSQHDAFLNCPQIRENKEELVSLLNKIKQGQEISTTTQISSVASFGRVKRDYDQAALEASTLYSKISRHLPLGVRFTGQQPGRFPTCTNI